MTDDDLKPALQAALAARKLTYWKRRWQELERLRAALGAGDFESLRAIGHDLHGSGGMYGFDALSSIGRELERAATDRMPERIDALLAQYEAELRDSAPAVEGGGGLPQP